MKIHTLNFDQSTFGITGKSLRKLRNAIAENLNDEILVAKVQTSDILCGFLLLNKTNGSAIWSGDGFRTDKGGEGGRGYAGAIKMLDAFGVKYFDVYTEEAVKDFQTALNINSSEIGMSKSLLAACNKIAEDFEETEYKCYFDAIPYY